LEVCLCRDFFTLEGKLSDLRIEKLSEKVIVCGKVGMRNNQAVDSGENSLDNKESFFIHSPREEVILYHINRKNLLH
jgi:hypothetical protein